MFPTAFSVSTFSIPTCRARLAPTHPVAVELTANWPAYLYLYWLRDSRKLATRQFRPWRAASTASGAVTDADLEG